MDVSEFHDDGVRCIGWSLPNSGWDDLSATICQFLTDALTGILQECSGEQLNWIEMNYWPDSGRLMVFPSQSGPLGDRDEPIFFQLCSGYLTEEWNRIAAIVDQPEQQERQWEKLATRLWDRVSVCLSTGDAGETLKLAREKQTIKLAAYHYNPGEGIFRLPELTDYP